MPRCARCSPRGEGVEFVSWGIEYALLEYYFMGFWAYSLNRRAVVLTDQRILLLQIDSRRRVRELKSEVRTTSGSGLGAPGKPGHLGWTERKSVLKLCGGTRWVTNPTRQRLATRRKRVLRGDRVTGAAKRRQRVCRPCD